MDSTLPSADSAADQTIAEEAVHGSTVEAPPAESPSPAVAVVEAPAAAVAESPSIPDMRIELSRVAQDLQIRKVQVESVVHLLDEGNTVPFITRYRRERTGGLSEDIIRRIRHRVAQLRHLIERKTTILKSIAVQGHLNDELLSAVVAADSPKRLEDLYLRFKPKKRTPASDARDSGLEPLALAIWQRDAAVANLDEVLPTMVDPDKGLGTVEKVVEGVGSIIAELIAENSEVRGVIRSVLWDTAQLTVTKSDSLPEGKGQEFKDYFEFKEQVRHIPPHRVLAINRGEKENALKVKLEFDLELIRQVTGERLPIAEHPHFDRLVPMIEDGVTKIILPSLEREVRRELSERAQDHAIAVFARNLRSLLLQPPMRNVRVLAIDPGFRTGCRVAVLDETGHLLEHATIHPHPPQSRCTEAKHKLEELIRKHQISVIALGNGAACRDTEELIAKIIAEFDARRRGETLPACPPPADRAEPAENPKPEVATVAPETPQPAAEGEVAATPNPEAPPIAETPPPLPAESPVAQPAQVLAPLDGLPEPPAALAYVIVNEAGARDYATSPLGREEFPDVDAALRSTISIGRRLQDPLGELVKIDPQHVGVGLYQHDVHPKFLKESLEEVIESCVNHVGVDLNSAGVSLLRHVAGLNQHAARELVEYRKLHGPYGSREQLKQAPGMNELRWNQAVGFVKVVGDEPLDATWIHPETYTHARDLLTELGEQPDALKALTPEHSIHEKMRQLPIDALAARFHIAPGAICDLLDALGRPGRDPREDSPAPVLKKNILQLEDLQAGMELKGTVLNVVPFGAFIDIGLKDSGLVHISQIANRYIKSPHEVVSVGDVVTVWVLNVDGERRRASLTMIAPGTERKQQEKKPQLTDRQHPHQRQSDRPRQRGASPRREGGPPQHREDRRPKPAANSELQRPAPLRAPRQLPERKPPKPKPLPKLTQAKKEGKEYLTTLGELAAFFKAREQPESPPPPMETAPADSAPIAPAEAPPPQTPPS